jgi:7-carboxy-7-deazaguanine synthase
MAIEEIVERVAVIGAPLVEITGGEPLLQEEVYPLMEKLCNRRKETVLLETGGFLSVAKVDPRVHKIIDLKPPSSGVSGENNPENIDLALRQKANADRLIELKIVIADRDDYIWARDLFSRTSLTETCTVMMGVAYGLLQPVSLAEWILEDRLNVRMQLQLHKYIWPPDTSGV